MGTNGQNVLERRRAEALVKRPELPETFVAPAGDIYETSDAFVVKLDMPGATTEAISLNVEPGHFFVRARLGSYHGDRAAILMSEIGRKSYFREFNLGRGVNHNAVQAQFADGVLTIILPKTEESKVREIQIKS